MEATEARSLASLNYLAANPPQYPLNPAEEKQDPLTLYISRVPGTRDVILSTSKPQLKNVTVEDVANSFYYINFDSSASPRHDAYASGETSPSGRNIPRKPLPTTARPLTPDSPRISVEQPVIRAPVPQGHGFRNLEDSGISFSNSVTEPALRLSGVPARKPIGARPLSKDGVTTATSPGNSKEEPFTSSEREYEPYYSDRPSSHHSRPSSHHSHLQPSLQPDHVFRRETRPISYPNNSSRLSTQMQEPDYSIRPLVGRLSRSSSVKKHSSPFTLNLIRRDPSSGNQWNVGRISSHQLKAPLDDGGPPSPTFSARPPIDILLETSGYAKFRNMPARRSSEHPFEDQMPNESGMFARQVVMAYSKSWSSHLKENSKTLSTNLKENSKTLSLNLKDKWNRMDKGALGRSAHAKHQSMSSLPAKPIMPVLEIPPTPGQPGPGMKPRGYTFTSPWNGRCDFRTGNAGRSVRCHHTLHPQLQDTHISPQQPSSVVSELRFNLPSSSPESEAQQALGSLAKFWRGSSEEDDEDDEVSPFDVNLGRERAGGGNRGKRAKLGKLIIWGEGLKMLDLVVAANMGVWWGAWERNF